VDACSAWNISNAVLWGKTLENYEVPKARVVKAIYNNKKRVSGDYISFVIGF
jgi:hypothetical protein